MTNFIKTVFRKSSRNSMPFIFNKQDGWYSREEFYDIIKRERNRSDRTGLPFSYLLIDFSRYKETDHSISNNDYSQFLKEFSKLISLNTRDYDIKYIDSHGKVTILLIDTSTDGAKIFVQKITKKIFQHFSKDNNPKYIKIIKSITISSYPIKQIEKSSEIRATPILVKNFGYMNILEVEEQYQEYREFYSVKLKWQKISSSNGSIALSTPIFFDFINGEILNWPYHYFKRCIDLVGSIMGLILFLPLMLIITLAIKFTSKGPAIFKQQRLGYLGKTFTFLKFRTMNIDSDQNIHKLYVKKLINGANDEVNKGSREKPLYKIDNDPRITPIGKVLRKTSLDELPQLINVLIGDMSLVGPRPPIPYEVEEYRNWHNRRILEVKPGITGLWQVSGRSTTTFDEMVRMDLQYVTKRSFYLDLKIILKTFIAVFNTKGAL